MTASPSSSREYTRVAVTIQGEQFQLNFQATVPRGPTSARELLPLVRSLDDLIVKRAIQIVEEAGERVSCTSGCGACCRSLVAISQIEAREICDVVAALPEPRRSMIQERFRNALHQLDAAGHLTKVRDFDAWTDDDYSSMVGTYFSVGIPCPFLEEESCSIYAVRPMTCREFLVVSPPSLCGRLDSVGVQQVRLPMRLFNALARWQVQARGEFLERWLPLVLALEWAELHPDEAPSQPGPALLESLIKSING